MLPPLKNPRWGELQKSHMPTVLRERESTKRSSRTNGVIQRLRWEPVPDVGEHPIDWDAELAEFKDLPYPAYYLEPVHSVPGGWLSREAALGNRQAMQAIYTDVHPEKCMGMRKELAKFVPEDARSVIDLGAGDGDGSAAMARQLPQAHVVAVEASPFMIIMGRRQNSGISNLEFRHCLAEATGLPAGSCDCVTITLVFHEVDDAGKAEIIHEAFRLLRAGGTLVFTDNAPQCLPSYNGFYEPWKDQWQKFDPDTFLATSGFTDIHSADVAAYPRIHGPENLFTRIAKKPASKL